MAAGNPTPPPSPSVSGWSLTRGLYDESKMVSCSHCNMYFDSFCFKLLHYRSGPCQDKLRTSFLRAKGPQAVGHDNWEELTRWECDDVIKDKRFRYWSMMINQDT